MQQKWAHQQHATAICQARDLAKSVACAQHLGLTRPALPMRSRHDAQRTFSLATVVQV